MQKVQEPPKEELEDLLFNQLLSKKKVAAYYSVCIRVISRWMKLYGLTYKITPELQQLKRDKTHLLKQKAKAGETVCETGFNSEFIEEYITEREISKRLKAQREHERKEKLKNKRVRK